MSHENEPSNNHLEAEIITRKTGKPENKLSNRKSTAKPGIINSHKKIP